MATLVALGPGDPDLVPLASWRAISEIVSTKPTGSVSPPP